MQFHEYGDTGKKTLMVMHGMICDWRKFRELFMPLEQDFRVIYPAMNGCYDGAPNFNCFTDECTEIEQYIIDRHEGHFRDFLLELSWGRTSVLAIPETDF